MEKNFFLPKNENPLKRKVLRQRRRQPTTATSIDYDTSLIIIRIGFFILPLCVSCLCVCVSGCRVSVSLYEYSSTASWIPNGIECDIKSCTQTDRRYTIIYTV